MILNLGLSLRPSSFPVAEQMGLINSIGANCLEQACRTAATWPQHLVVAVNLSPLQFLSGSLINDVRNALEKARLPAYRLEVEITEGTLLNDSELVLGQLRMLRDMGVAVSLTISAGLFQPWLSVEVSLLETQDRPQFRAGTGRDADRPQHSALDHQAGSLASPDGDS